MENIGKKIKNLRKKRGLTQKELADRCELTKGFISQVESGNTLPSLPTLADLLQCLGTDLKQFFGDDEDHQIVFKKSDYFEKENTERNNKVEFLVPSAQKNMMEPLLLTLEPGGYTDMDQPHEGEEFGYVLSGSVELILDNVKHKVRKGETFYFETNVIHGLRSEKGAKILWISTPPNF